MKSESLFAVLLCALIGSTPAFAVCTTGQPAHVYIGNTTADHACKYNNIQAALDNETGNACGLVIDVTPEVTYTNQALTITNKSLTMQAWGKNVTCSALAAGCTASNCPAPSGTEITLSGQNGHSVIDILYNSNVTINNFEIEGGCVGLQCGDTVARNGGGINFEGSGSLVLNSDFIAFNKADNGAGVAISYTDFGGIGNLTLGANTQILGNSASNQGGGVDFDSLGNLYMDQPDIVVSDNTASGGGGMVIFGGTVYLGSSRADANQGVIDGNSANFGGGIELAGGTLYIYTTNDSQPTTIANNSAITNGGGLWVDDGIAFLNDFQIVNNSATEGAAIFTSGDSYGEVHVNYIDPVSVRSNAVPCNPSPACNAIRNNMIEGGSSDTGSIIQVENFNNTTFNFNRFSMRGNQANENLIHGVASFVDIRSCLLADNTVGKSLINNDSALSVAGCTIANNSLGAPVITTGGDSFELVNSIINQPSALTWAFPRGYSGVYIRDDLLSGNDISGISVSQGIPTFSNAAAGDYHLTSSSLGVDVAPIGGGAHPYSSADSLGNTDLDGNSRDIDLPQVPNLDGPRDLGAYEVQIRRHLPPTPQKL